MTQTRFYTVPEIARLVRMSANAIRSAIATGALPAHDFGSGARAAYRVRQEDLDAWLERRRVGRLNLPSTPSGAMSADDYERLRQERLAVVRARSSR